MGRKSKLSNQQIEHAKKLIGEGERVEKIAVLLGVSKETIYRVVKE